MNSSRVWTAMCAVALGASLGTPGPLAAQGSAAPKFRLLTAGAYHACGLTHTGEAYCWGEGSNGQLGDGSTELRLEAGSVSGGLRFVQLHASGDRTCGVTQDGVAYCWGANPGIELTRSLRGLQDTQRGVPVPVAEGIRWRQVETGEQHGCGLADDGRAFCWGYGLRVVGTAGDTARRGPVPVAGDHAFEALTAGDAHMCALTPDGRAWCWGSGRDGQLGNGAAEPSYVPVAVAGDLAFQSISAAARHSCAVTTSGETYCWGWNAEFQLGRLSEERCDGYPCSTRPRLVPVAALRTVEAGDGRSCGIGTDAGLYCWGDDRPYAMRMDETSPAYQPVRVAPTQTFTAVSIGATRICALDQTGAVDCWSSREGLPKRKVPLSQRVDLLFVLCGVVGALLGGLLSWAFTRVRPMHHPAVRIIQGAFAGALGGMMLFVAWAVWTFLDNLPW